MTSGQFADSLPLISLSQVPVRAGRSASARSGPGAGGPFGSGFGTAERAEADV